MGVKVLEPAQYLVANFGEELFAERDAVSGECFESSHVDVLHADGDVAAWDIEHAVALDDVGGVDAAKDGDLSKDLAPEGRVTVAVNDFQCVDFRGVFVADFVDCSSVPVADYLKLL